MGDSFTNGKTRTATAKDLSANWSGYDDGRNFRCYLCGHFYQVGDRWRWVYANFPKSPVRIGNFTVCDGCDDDDVIARMARHVATIREIGWWALPHEHRPRRPPATPEEK